MSDEAETFPLTLGKRRWDLPHLPFGVIRKLQPKLMRLNSGLARENGTSALALALDEKALDEMLGLVADALGFVDPTINRDVLDRLVFPVGDLIAAQNAVMRACGLVFAKRDAAPGAETETSPKA